MPFLKFYLFPILMKGKKSTNKNAFDFCRVDKKFIRFMFLMHLQSEMMKDKNEEFQFFKVEKEDENLIISIRKIMNNDQFQFIHIDALENAFRKYYIYSNCINFNSEQSIDFLLNYIFYII